VFPFPRAVTCCDHANNYTEYGPGPNSFNFFFFSVFLVVQGPLNPFFFAPLPPFPSASPIEPSPVSTRRYSIAGAFPAFLIKEFPVFLRLPPPPFPNATWAPLPCASGPPGASPTFFGFFKKTLSFLLVKHQSFGSFSLSTLAHGSPPPSFGTFFFFPFFSFFSPQ